MGHQETKGWHEWNITEIAYTSYSRIREHIKALDTIKYSFAIDKEINSDCQVTHVWNVMTAL